MKEFMKEFMEAQLAINGRNDLIFMAPTGMIAIVNDFGSIIFGERVLYSEQDSERSQFPRYIKKSSSSFLLQQAGFKFIGEL